MPELKYELPCRYCNYELPLNPRFIKDIKIIDGQFRILLTCPNCGIDNNKDARNWIELRNKWRQVRSGSPRQ